MPPASGNTNDILKLYLDKYVSHQHERPVKKGHKTRTGLEPTSSNILLAVFRQTSYFLRPLRNVSYASVSGYVRYGQCKNQVKFFFLAFFTSLDRVKKYLF